jgi:hypothetical protein
MSFLNLGGLLPMPPMPPGLPNPLGGGGGGGGLGNTMQTQDGGGSGGGLGGTIQTEDSGYQQNLAGLLQMMGANQNQPRTTVISDGGLI